MNIVLSLKECSKNLMSFAHNAEAGHINEQTADARKLCDCIEQILLNEIKIREFQGIIPLWQLLERLENANPPCIPLRNNVGAIASIPSLKTPFSKVRGWIRQSLNSNCMDESIQFLIKQNTLVNQFYYPEAVLRNEIESKSFVAVLRSLRILPFNFTVDDKQLVVLPGWTERLIAAQSASPPPSHTAPPTASVSSAKVSQSRPSFVSSSSSSSGGSALDSFFMSVESSLQRVIQKVDTVSVAAAQFITTTLENSNSNNNNGGSEEEGESRASADRIDRFLSSGSNSAAGTSVKYAITPFFGSSLKQLVLDSNRCSHANLNPLLGIPNQAVKMINFIGAHVNQPDLFRQRASLSAIHELRLSVEEERPLPPTVDISTVTHVLVQWLNQLPEPLLGYEHFVAMLDCTVNSAALYNKTEQLRNFSLLVQDAPWYCKPLLVKLLSLLHKCIQPEHTVNNKLTTVAISILTTPCLLREYNEQANALLWKKSSSEELDRIMLAAVAAGSSTVEYFIENSNDILQPIKTDLAAKQTNLGVKCNRIRALQENLNQPVNVKILGVQRDSEAAGLVSALWHCLLTCENLLRVTEGAAGVAAAGDNGAVVPSVDSLLTHSRWEICGFVHSLENLPKNPSDAKQLQSSDLTINRLPLLEFNTPHGLIGLQCLVAFLKRYPDKGAAILADFASNRKRYCTAPQVIVRLTHFVADALHLLPAAAAQLGSVVDFTQTVPVQTIAKYPAWILLNDELCFQELFDVAMLSFDDAWKSSCERVEQLPNSETYSVVLTKCRKTLSDVLSKNPKSINMVWEIWMNSRVREQEALANRMPAKRPLLKTNSSNTTNAPSDISSSVGSGSSVSQPVTAISSTAVETSNGKSSSEFDFDEFVSGHNGEYPNGGEIQIIMERQGTVSNKDGERKTEKSGNDSVATPAVTDSSSSFSASSIGQERADWNVDLHSLALQTNVSKLTSGITSKVVGGSQILNEKHIQQLEAGLPQAFQCYDWKLIYRLSIHGANISTLINKAHGVPNSLLVIRDSQGAIFGALITDYLKIGEKEKYYGNGTIGVWSFVSGTFKFYNWSYRNSYFLLSSKDAIAVGGGGNFAIYLDSDLNKGCSGDCQTFSSPCLSSQEQFVCNSCELFSFEASK